MQIALEKTTTDAFVGLKQYEDGVLIPENALMPRSIISLSNLKCTSYLNKNTSTAPC